VRVAAERLHVVACDDAAGALGEDVDLVLAGLGEDVVDDAREIVRRLEEAPAEQRRRHPEHRPESIALQPGGDGVEPLAGDGDAGDEEHRAWRR
jgi:hypothetical protein